MTKKPLQVLNASAGSGKTYHLVKAYIRLLIGDNAGSNAFAHIIAMTFTNKAALEMKERIIQALDAIGSPGDHPLTSELAAELALSEPEVEERCHKVLKGILHRYEDFHVMTIDKFNLRLIKSFGRDLDLPHDFEVILDEGELIEKIVDDLLNQLGESGSKPLNKLILAYARANVDDGNQWNFRRSLIEFGRILNSEKNNSIVERLLQMDFSPEHYGMLRKERSKIDERFEKLSEQLEHAVNAGLNPELLPGKSTTFKGIQKLIYTREFPTDPDTFSKTLIKNLDAELKSGQEFPENVKSIIREMYHLQETQLREYITLELFMKHFFNMALLQYMAEALKQVRKDEQLIRISEFNTLISQLIQHESTPFIYERLGTRFHHFLLDEFQDTSRLQWLNMVPLVRESISQNKENLIVGDPKQSIYRFKNGVAEQFVELPEIYNPEKDPYIAEHSAYFRQMGEVAELSSNWRSAPSIVHFNNAFFHAFREQVPGTIADFYNAVEQTPQSTKNGRIYIVSKEEKKLPDALVPQLIEWIRECGNEGFKPGEICILGNTNRECNRWAIGLNEAGYRVVSTDSLLIHNSLKVQLTIAYLKRRLRPTGENETRRFAELYFRLHSGNYNDYQQYIRELHTEEGKPCRHFDNRQFLLDHFEGEDNFFYNYESIYDLIQRFYGLMKYEELRDPYLHHLADFAFDFGLHKGPDLKGFLLEYESKKHKIAVQIPESEDAIQVMTIHKSKGLEFPVVMVPSMNFPADVKSHFLVDMEDFVVYKKPNQSEQLQLLQELYDREREQIIADNMNKCYVAMTRPMERLYVANYYEKRTFGRLFHEVLETLPQATTDDGLICVELNDGIRSTSSNGTSPAKDFIPNDIRDHLWFPHIALQDTPELVNEDFLSDEMQYGLEFHLLAGRVERKDDITPGIEKAIQSGEVARMNAKALAESLNGLFRNASYLELLDNADAVISEQAILTKGGTVLRPDKLILKKDQTILLDYKTGIPSGKDENQVRGYAEVVRAMGYPNVSAFLFYIHQNELRQIG